MCRSKVTPNSFMVELTSTQDRVACYCFLKCERDGGRFGGIQQNTVCSTPSR